ncbi:MAG: hypothetical protein CVU72_02360 [Deltaproteobacteria bacterium HGW-Deltaproteobacteria-7]|jgi:hypothetical protein|nr:MAG: hypothetical protein CVU72_02360 [Deltaproteobacteria bacterium HGW-Deltaproteobacteria-7]PKN19816.1 MAG: hypothetical protein CVU71_05470 [Deltaproteobacteria bacterium HGW-Deltaproteobacteria-6]
MKISIFKTVILALTLVLTWSLVYAIEPIEKDKIDYLINSVEKSSDILFIRNGSAHNGKEAASHLRAKLQKAGNSIKTADDFIILCASKSYISGRPYLIKISNGKTIIADVYFRNLLKGYKRDLK